MTALTEARTTLEQLRRAKLAHPEWARDLAAACERVQKWISEREVMPVCPKGDRIQSKEPPYVK
jgi:hypothetical protein